MVYNVVKFLMFKRVTKLSLNTYSLVINSGFLTTIFITFKILKFIQSKYDKILSSLFCY